MPKKAVKKVATAPELNEEVVDGVVDLNTTVAETEAPADAVVVAPVEEVEEPVVVEEAPVEEVKVTVAEVKEATVVGGTYIALERVESPLVQTRIAKLNMAVVEGRYIGPFADDTELAKVRKVIAAVGIKTSVVQR